MANPLKQLAGETAIYGLSSILARVLNFLFVPIYTRMLTQEQYGFVYDTLMPPQYSDSSYAKRLSELGWADPASPSRISLYTSTFESKDAIADLDTMQQQIMALKDSLTIGSTGQRIERIGKKGKRLLNASKKLISDARDEALAVLDKGEGTLQKLRTEIDDASNHGAVTVEKASELLTHIDGLLGRVKELKKEAEGLASRLDANDNTVALVVSGHGKLVRELEKLAKDINKLTQDIKKKGLKINIDIF